MNNQSQVTDLNLSSIPGSKTGAGRSLGSAQT